MLGRRMLLSVAAVLLCFCGAAHADAIALQPPDDGHAPHCSWPRLVFVPFVPKTDFYLVNHTMVNTCDGDPDVGPLSPEHRVQCLRCSRIKTRGACLRTVGETYFNGADVISCVWNDFNTLGERTREVRQSLGTNNPSMMSTRAYRSACSTTHQYTVFSKQEDYPTAYFSMLGTGEFVNTPEGGACDGALGCKGDGEWLPGGWQPDASCVVQPGSRSCSFTLHHTPDLQFLVTARDVWVANPAIKAQLRSPNNEKCLTEPGRKCVVASPRFFFGLKVTEHKCRRAGQLDGQTAVRCSGSFPMAQPGMLMYPGDNPKSYRETGFELEGVAYVHWELRSRVPLLVMLAPHEVAFNACPLGTPFCDYTKVLAQAYKVGQCYSSHCSGYFAKPRDRNDVLLIAYPKFRTTPVPNPAETPPTIVDFRLTGWKR